MKKNVLWEKGDEITRFDGSIQTQFRSNKSQRAFQLNFYVTAENIVHEKKNIIETNACKVLV